MCIHRPVVNAQRVRQTWGRRMSHTYTNAQCLLTWHILYLVKIWLIKSWTKYVFFLITRDLYANYEWPDMMVEIRILSSFEASYQGGWDISHPPWSYQHLRYIFDSSTAFTHNKMNFYLLSLELSLHIRQYQSYFMIVYWPIKTKFIKLSTHNVGLIPKC